MNYWNLFGLIFDFLGFVILFIWGIPTSPWMKKSDQIKQEKEYIKNEEEYNRRNPHLDDGTLKHYFLSKDMSTIGLILIIAGFFLQLLGVFYTNNTVPCENEKKEYYQCPHQSISKGRKEKL